MTSCGIIGGGFGLYGYLPAACRAEFSNVITLEKYKSAILERRELKSLVSQILYVDDIEQLLDRCDVIVAARRPEDNVKILQKIENKKVIIEKPISVSPTAALELLHELSERGNQVYSGFIFKYLDWWVTSSNKNTIKNVTWGIEKKNSNLSWKYSEAHGGGLLSFYCIHLLYLATLKNLKLYNAQYRATEEMLELNFIDEACNKITFCVYYTDKELFQVRLQDGIISYESSGPFGGSPKAECTDIRVPYIERLFGEVISEEKQPKIIETLELWHEIKRELRN